MCALSSALAAGVAGMVDSFALLVDSSSYRLTYTLPKQILCTVLPDGGLWLGLAWRGWYGVEGARQQALIAEEGRLHRITG